MAGSDGANSLESVALRRSALRAAVRPTPTSREFPINSLIKVDRLAALAKKEGEDVEHDKKGGGSVGNGCLVLDSNGLLCFLNQNFRPNFRPSSRFRPASMIVIIAVSHRVSGINTENERMTMNEGERVEKRGRPDDGFVLASRKNPLTRSEFRLKMDAREAGVSSPTAARSLFVYLFTHV